MITITEQKPLEEVTQCLAQCQAVYLIGCGTCATTLHTGGKSEVLDMKDKLEAAGKKVAGWMVIPTACDELTREALAEEAGNIELADCILVMSCAFGVQTVGFYTDKPVYPALNTMFIGKEESPGLFIEVCGQCGNCLLASTAGICPVVRCTKGLVNGPCGGTNNGKCEVDPDKDCAWTLIYQRLEKQDRLDVFDEYHPPRNFQAVVRPGRFLVSKEKDDG
jgi:hypothetical protein